MPKKKDWCDKLSPQNKAEILAGVLHTLTCHMPDVWSKIPKWYQAQLRRVMWDCSNDMKSFSDKDLKQMRVYFAEFIKKCPEPKRKK